MDTQAKTVNTAPTSSPPAEPSSKSSSVTFNIEQQCPIQSVTVYNDRAEVTRQLQHHFGAEGTYDLVFQGFSPSVDLNSLHVSGGTGKACTILEVSYQTRFENTALNTELTPLDQLQNDLDQIEAAIEKHQQELARISKQRTWLDGRASKLMGQEEKVNTGDLESMQQFMEFYRRTLRTLDDETVKEETESKRLRQQQQGLKSNINEHGASGAARRQKAIREVTVTVHIATSDADLGLEVSYLISQCSWSASYDVRVSSTEASRQKTQLTYYGAIVNKSGENWSDVQLSLSTATPSLGGTPPKLATLRVGYYQPPAPSYPSGGASYLMASGLMDDMDECRREDAPSRALEKRKSAKSMSFRARTSLRSQSIEESCEYESPESTVNVLAAKTEASMSSASFSIPRRSTIAADGKPHKVTIGVLDLSSTFMYTVVPKLSLHAYLKASTTNTSDKQLLAGPVSVFMDNNFVTHSSIENVCLGDTFDLPLGTDASVKVEYKPVIKRSDTQGLLNKVMLDNIRHETRLTNTKASAVTVHVFEQVPQSSHEKIKVKLIAPDLRLKEHAPNCTVTMNDSNNLEWKCILQPRGECRLPVEYSMEWPTGRRIEFTEL